MTFLEDYDQIYKLDVDFDDPKKLISPAHLDLYRIVSEDIDEFIWHLKNTKTVKDITVEPGELRPKIVPVFKNNHFKYSIGENKKAIPNLKFAYNFYNVWGSFSRFAMSLRTDLASFLIPFAHPSVSKFDKNSLKFQYSLPLPFEDDKIQCYFKRINRLDGKYQKIGVSFDRFLENINFGVFRIKSMSNPETSQTRLKIKVKHGHLFQGEVPEGKCSEYRLQFAPFSPQNSNFHFKLMNKVYQNFDFLPFRSNLELFNQFSISTRKTSDYINRLGFPNDEERNVNHVPFFINHHFHLKLNFYDIIGLREFNISAFAFYAYMSRFFQPSRSEFGWGVEKYFSTLGIRLQCAYSVLTGGVQFRVTQN